MRYCFHYAAEGGILRSVTVWSSFYVLHCAPLLLRAAQRPKPKHYLYQSSPPAHAFADGAHSVYANQVK